MKAATKEPPRHQQTTTASKSKAITEAERAKKTSTLFSKQKSQLGQVQTTKESDLGIHMTQILNYYRDRVEAFERDRVQWYQKLEAVRVKQEHVHRAEWELKKRQEEKTELERALLQCQAALAQERERVVRTKAAADELRVRGKENRQLVAQLLDKSNAVEQHIFYQKDGAPEKIQSFAKKAQGPDAKQTISAEPRPPNVLRTIHLPNDQAFQVKSEVEALHQQVTEQRLAYERALDQLRAEKGDYEEAQRVKYIDYAEQVEKLLGRLQEQEVFNCQVVKDHVDEMA